MKIIVHMLFPLLLACVSIAAAAPIPAQIVLRPAADGRGVIGPALSAAPSGSVILLQKGIYREIVTIAKPVSLLGDDGAVLDPSEPFRPKWESAKVFGPGVFRATLDRAPAALFLDGLVLAHVDPQRREACRKGPGTGSDWSHRAPRAPGST